MSGMSRVGKPEVEMSDVRRRNNKSRAPSAQAESFPLEMELGSRSRPSLLLKNLEWWRKFSGLLVLL